MKDRYKLVLKTIVTEPGYSIKYAIGFTYGFLSTTWPSLLTIFLPPIAFGASISRDVPQPYIVAAMTFLIVTFATQFRAFGDLPRRLGLHGPSTYLAFIMIAILWPLNSVEQLCLMLKNVYEIVTGKKKLPKK